MVFVDRYAPAAGHHEPPGTESQVLLYRDPARGTSALAFRYLRRDGSYGGSGWIDPKMVQEGNVRYFPNHDDRQQCPDCAAYRPLALAFPRPPLHDVDFATPAPQ